MGEKIAVTGGAGFIGSHMVKRLLKEGREVVVIDDFSTGSMDNLPASGTPNLQIIKGDLRDYEFARKALAGARKVYHFAAIAGGVVRMHASPTDELAAMQTNLVVDTNVFRSCKENQVRNVIYASSVSVYSLREQLTSHAVFREEDSERDINPEGGYGWSKYVGEQQLRISGMRCGIARIFHVYGPNMPSAEGIAPVIPIFFKRALNYPKEQFVIHGDGTQKRCFVYIDDTIEALQKLSSYIEANGNLTVNIGSVEEITVKELAGKIIRLSGKEIPIVYDQSKPTGTNSRKPDLERIKRVLNWESTVNLDEGLAKTYEWARVALPAKS